MFIFSIILKIIAASFQRTFEPIQSWLPKCNIQGYACEKFPLPWLYLVKLPMPLWWNIFLQKKMRQVFCTRFMCGRPFQIETKLGLIALTNKGFKITSDISKNDITFFHCSWSLSISCCFPPFLPKIMRVIRSLHSLFSCKRGGEVWHLLWRRADRRADAPYYMIGLTSTSEQFFWRCHFHFQVLTNWKLCSWKTSASP